MKSTIISFKEFIRESVGGVKLLIDVSEPLDSFNKDRRKVSRQAQTLIDNFFTTFTYPYQIPCFELKHHSPKLLYRLYFDPDTKVSIKMPVYVVDVKRNNPSVKLVATHVCIAIKDPKTKEPIKDPKTKKDKTHNKLIWIRAFDDYKEYGDFLHMLRRT